MSNASPQTFLIWSILSCLFLVYLIYHLWNYDRLRCVLWNSGRQPGAFKRVMTYSYFLTIPLLLTFSLGITILKYREGYILIPSPDSSVQHGPLLPPGRSVGTSFPKPVELWSTAHRHSLLAMYFVFSIAWALEQVTHFEELTFWLFLLDQKTEKRVWFESWEYRLWYTSCVGAILGMPLTTLVSRKNLETTDAWTFLVGSSMSTFTNVAFLYVLARFPAFLRHVKEEGASPDVVVRLSLFYELNLVRIMFRFAVCLPLLVLSVDGVQGTHPINNDIFWTDFLLMIVALGQFVSSAITLMIFFPRSIAKDAGYHHKAPSGTLSSASAHTASFASSYHPSGAPSAPASQYPSRTNSYYPSGVTSHYPSGATSHYPSGANSYYPPGVHSPRSPSYPPSAAALTSPALTSPAMSVTFPPPSQQTPSPPSAQQPTTQTQGQRPTPFLLRRPTGASGASGDSAHEDDEDDDEVPEYEPGDAYALRVRRSGGKGVEFAVPDEVRRETARMGTGTGSRRASAQSSVLHPYVTNFTSPIDLAGEPSTSFQGRLT